VVLERAFSAASEGVRPQGRVNDATITAVADVAVSLANTYALRRSGAHLELRVNGVVLGSSDLSPADQSTSNAEDILLGVVSQSAPTGIDTIQAVFLVRGSVGSTALEPVEQYLQQTFPTTR
jgi:hypothetical protein